MNSSSIDTAFNWLMVVGPLLVTAGLSIWGFSDGNRSLALWLGFGGGVLLMLAGALQLQGKIWNSKSGAPHVALAGQGGSGGSASVGGSGIAIGGAGGLGGEQGSGGAGGSVSVGGNGVAIGGPGGHAGKYGKGGAGGGGHHAGDVVAAGGGGGSVDSDTHWYPPAPSGYEVHQLAMGLPVDPTMRQFGRGGMSPGYAVRYQVVEGIRTNFFETQGLAPRTALEDVNAVPLDYVNEELQKRGVPWRARVVRDLDYEFFIPEGH
jgi:hypothetical protein